MDTMILVSGGWRSAYALVHWLRTHSGKIYALTSRLGDGHDAGRGKALPGLREYVNGRFPDRVRWIDVNIAHTLGHPLDTRASLAFAVQSVMSTPLGNQIKTVLVGKKIDVARKAEVVADVSLIDALGELPPSVWRVLHYCETMPACGKCPACTEIREMREKLKG